MKSFLALTLAVASFAVQTTYAKAGSDAPLTLQAAAELAVANQPILEAQQGAVRAAREAAVASAQLPDPVLVGGLTDLTIDGPDRYTLKNESDTQFILGVKQSFPGAGKRDLRGTKARAEADRLGADFDEQQRMIRRETALAWLDAWRARQAQALVKQSIAEAEKQLQVVDIAYRSGRAAQADLFSARVAVELLNDEFANTEQDEWHARNQLRRWIGDAADRPLDDALPDWPAPDTAYLAKHLEHHPHIAAAERAVDLAQAELKLARADYRPDWSVQAGYGYRPQFADYASVQFEIALPAFTAQRQDRTVAARSAKLERAEALRDDALKQNRAAIELNVGDWQRLEQRFARYDTAILPQAQGRMEAATTAYGAGSGPLVSLLDARRSLLDIRMQRLELQLDAARHQVQLEYYAYQEARS